MHMLFGACLFLGIGTALGQEELVTTIDENQWARSIVYLISLYFSLSVHMLDAVYFSGILVAKTDRESSRAFELNSW